MFNPSRGKWSNFGLIHMFQKMGWWKPPPPSYQRLLGLGKLRVPGSRRQSKECASPCMLTAYPSPETSKGWGVWGVWGVWGWLEGSEVDGWSWQTLQLGYVWFEEPFRNYDEKNQATTWVFFRGHGDCRCLEKINGKIYASKSLKWKQNYEGL